MSLSVLDPTMVIYHGGCPDGTGAAWVMHHAFNRVGQDGSESVQFHAAAYNRDPPDVAGHTVAILDFSYAPDVLRRMAESAKLIILIDHHESALKGLQSLIDTPLSNLIIQFDMTRSGAQMAWDWVYPTTTALIQAQLQLAARLDIADHHRQLIDRTSAILDSPSLIDASEVKRPWFIETIGDRDLWKWSYEWSRDVSQGLFALGLTKRMEDLSPLFAETLDQAKSKYGMVGKPFNDKLDRDVTFHVGKTLVCEPKTPDGQSYRVGLSNAPWELRSEVGNAICKALAVQFSICWMYNFETDEWYLSFRGIDGSPNLHPIAKHFAGGGHPKASGGTIFGKRAQPAEGRRIGETLETFLTVLPRVEE